ncbi:MAG: DMT family transporter [Betaproteobacteria bacterium]|nr:DMT family transporter [Betaproteobacteria bacterium]
MRFSDLARLITLAAIWGASFLFVRMAVSSLGAAWLTELRISIAAAAMLLYARAVGLDLEVRRNLHVYLVIGATNVAIPWTIIAYAGHYINAGYLSILNASTPWFGAICAALWLGEPLTLRKSLGLALGLAGVALMLGFGPIEATPNVILSAALCFAAAACYALAGTYVKKRAAGVRPFSMTLGSLLVATLMLLPFLSGVPPATAFTWKVSIAVLGISLLGSAAAFLLYYRLMSDVGPTKTLTVTFLIPLFGVLWGVLFLDEELRLAMVVGGALVLAGTALVVASGPQAAAARGVSALK